MARNPVLYQKTLFRAFLGYNNKELFGEYVDRVKDRQYQVKNIAPAAATGILNQMQREGWKLDTMSNNVYVFVKETIVKETIGGMSIQDYIDASIMLHEYLKLLHAPYLKHD